MLIAGELERAGRGPEGLGVEPAFLDRVADSTGGAQPVGEPERALPKSSIGLDRQGRGLTEAAGGGEARGRGARANPGIDQETIHARQDVGRQGVTDVLVIIIGACRERQRRSEEHTSELQSTMRLSYAVLSFKQKN